MIRTRPKGTSIYADGLVTVAQAASFLGISRSHVYALMDDGLLVFSKIGRSRRIPKRALLMLAKQTCGTSQAQG